MDCTCNIGLKTIQQLAVFSKKKVVLRLPPQGHFDPWSGIYSSVPRHLPKQEITKHSEETETM